MIHLSAFTIIHTIVSVTRHKTMAEAFVHQGYGYCGHLLIVILCKIVRVYQHHSVCTSRNEAGPLSAIAECVLQRSVLHILTK